MHFMMNTLRHNQDMTSTFDFFKANQYLRIELCDCRIVFEIVEHVENVPKQLFDTVLLYSTLLVSMMSVSIW